MGSYSMEHVNGVVKSESDTIPLGLYLWNRIKQLGVSTVMGVPGDFNLELLDYIYDVPGLDLVCNANELNSAYAADGYARVKGVPGVFVTTHGVGELSALNGVMGSLSERIRVIHVVGQTPKPHQEGHKMIHHSVGTHADHQMYNKLSKSARIAEAELWDASSAPAEIDRAIRECMIQCAPVYIFMPLDLCMAEVSAARLQTPIDVTPVIDSQVHESTVRAIQQTLFAAKKPIMFVDGLAKSYHVQECCRAIARKLRIPVYHGTMGKAVIDETEEYYAGMYQGVISDPHLQDAFESSDCALVIGAVECDTNSGGFTRKFPVGSIKIDPYEVSIESRSFSPTHIEPLLNALSARLAEDETRVTRTTPPKPPISKPPIDAGSTLITHSWLWAQLVAQLQPHDVVVTETGTSVFGICYERMPADVRFITQTYYGSIGYATPAAFGAELALRELSAEQGKPRGRTVLITGDGSLNLTIQEIGTMIVQDVRPVIVVINNAGYTIERVIHGARQRYNDINPVRFRHLLTAFAHPDPESHSHTAASKEEFKKLFRDKREELREPKMTTVVELMLDKMDVPWRLTKQVSMRGPEYRQYLIDEGFIGEGRVGIGGQETKR